MEEFTNRQKQAARTKAKIQAAALDLFDRKGIDNVSIEEIAKAAGCSAGNIYHYFPNKDALAAKMTEIVDEVYEKYRQEYREDTETSSFEKLVDFAGRALIDSRDDPALYTCLIYGLKHPEYEDLNIKPERTYFSLLRELTLGCMEEGTLPSSLDPDRVVNELVAIHRGVLVEWRYTLESFAIEELGREIVRAFLTGLRGWKNEENKRT